MERERTIRLPHPKSKYDRKILLQNQSNLLLWQNFFSEIRAELAFLFGHEPQPGVDSHLLFYMDPSRGVLKRIAVISIVRLAEHFH